LIRGLKLFMRPPRATLAGAEETLKLAAGRRKLPLRRRHALFGRNDDKGSRKSRSKKNSADVKPLTYGLPAPF
jgi:hypothetical protein